ncbi:MAG: cation-translocating P-type ATPase [Bacilli bacterium]|nr:cation-translocating P-type ATPase [Bacilli bacterium]
MKIGNFKNNYTGLNNEQVKESKIKYGINSLGSVKKDSILKKLLNTFKEPMLLLLLGTCCIYMLLGQFSDSIIMFTFIFFIAGISFYQEYKTDKALETLKKISSPKSKVIRNNRIIEVKSDEIVVGDMMLVQEGNIINAEGDILECHDFSVNESSLTGESLIVWKKVKLNANEKKEYFKKNKCYSSTVVTGGEAIILITNVGINTEYGKIGDALEKIVEPKTLLEKQIRKLIIICAFISILFMVFVGLVTLINNVNDATTFFKRITDAILAGITIAMATIPEELPIILTVFLTTGAYLISKKKSLVRKMNAVETLGSISVLCVDKTGTLTENKMTVIDTYAHRKPEELLVASFLSCEKEAFDPMEQAIIDFCRKQNITTEFMDDRPVFEYPFSSETKIMGHVFNKNNDYNVYVKGAYEQVLPLCNLNEDEIKKISEKEMFFSNKGYRVLAVAHSKSSKIEQSLDKYQFSFAGLLAFVDPPRYGVKEAIESCYQAGIKLVMITGDNGETAKAIGKEIGLKNCEKVITGEELEKIDDEELAKIVKDVTIFARVYPNHKMRIVEAFQRNNMVVAMTGDGVNDATALKKADIGIAMGKRGTEVAKEASKLILLDDNFKTIITAVENGRRIYENIRKAIGYVLIVHIPIALVALLMPLLNFPILLLPIHVVLLELIIDPISSIVFQRCIADKDIMKKRPRKTTENILNKKYVFTYIVQGLVISLGFLGSYIYLLTNGYSNEMARTFALTVLILSNLFIVYVNINKNLTIINFINILKDKVISIINIVILIALIMVIYIPLFQEIVGTIALTFNQFLVALTIALLCTIWYDLIKIFQINRK